MIKKENKIKTYSDKVKLELDGFEIQYLMDLLEKEAIEVKNMLNIKLAISLYEKFEKLFKENWGK